MSMEPSVSSARPQAPTPADRQALLVVNMARLRILRRENNVTAHLRSSGLPLAPATVPLDSSEHSAAFAACEQVLHCGAVHLTNPVSPARTARRKVVLLNPVTGQVSLSKLPATVAFDGGQDLSDQESAWAGLFRPQALGEMEQGARASSTLAGLARIAMVPVMQASQLLVQHWVDAGRPDEGLILAVSGPEATAALPFAASPTRGAGQPRAQLHVLRPSRADDTAMCKLIAAHAC
jgi:hypothetical protein